MRRPGGAALLPGVVLVMCSKAQWAAGQLRRMHAFPMWNRDLQNTEQQLLVRIVMQPEWRLSTNVFIWMAF
jgi:hypothetical protein